MAAPSLMSAAFFGHGSPMNTLADNRYSRAWRAFAGSLPRPRGIVIFSAHWYTAGTRVSAAPAPVTIHDFNARFPAALFAYTYPARGDAALVERIIALAAPVANVREDAGWGIDHGAYSILAHAFPDADVPVVMVSLDRTKPPSWHYALGARLAPLRAEGIFVMGSGNVVHNLELADAGAGTQPFAWARRFDERVRDLLDAGDHAALVGYHALGADARLSVPTPEHYLPLLAVVAMQQSDERAAPIVDGFDFGAGSMLSVRLSE